MANSSNKEKFEGFIKKLNEVEFKRFENNKGYRENFKSLMISITHGVEVINEYKDDEEYKKGIPADCASKINKQRDRLSRWSRQKLLALDDYEKIVNLLGDIITNLNNISNKSTFAKNIEEYKNMFNQILDVRGQPFSSFRRNFSLCLQNEYWMSAKDAVSCFEDYMETDTVRDFTDVDAMLKIKPNELKEKLIVPASAKLVEYNVSKRAWLYTEVTRYLNKKSIQVSNLRSCPLSDIDVDNFYHDMKHFKDIIKEYDSKMNKSTDEYVFKNKLYEDHRDVYSCFWSAISEESGLFDEMGSKFKFGIFQDYIVRIVKIYDKYATEIHGKFVGNGVKDEELDLKVLSSLVEKLNEEGKKCSSETIRDEERFELPGLFELKKEMFREIFGISNSYFLLICIPKEEKKS